MVNTIRVLNLKPEYIKSLRGELQKISKGKKYMAFGDYNCAHLELGSYSAWGSSKKEAVENYLAANNLIASCDIPDPINVISITDYLITHNVHQINEVIL